MAELLLDFSKMPEAKKTNVAFVDTFVGGELIKETFDIEMVPSIRLVRGDQVYHLKLPKDNKGLWSVKDLRDFVKGGYESAPTEPLRSRVNEGIELKMEYLINTLTATNFEPAMNNYLALRKIVHEWTGFKHDLKSINPNFGKKNAFKKSQMWTLLIYVIIPLVLIGTILSMFILCLLISCLTKLCERAVNSRQEASKVSSDEPEKKTQ